MTDEELVDFFIMFEGAETIKKRVFRDHSSKDDNEGVWRFRGSVFVTFESLAEARVFYESFNEKDYGKLPLTYKGDKLVIKWQKDFYNVSYTQFSLRCKCGFSVKGLEVLKINCE